MASNLVNESPDTYPTAPVPLRRPRLDSAQRFLLVCGMLLVVSGIFHGIVLFATGGSLEGPLSWRKPTVFGLSFGIMAVTIAFVASTLRLGRGASWFLLGSLGVASVAETALITMQTWRGVPSHFNFCHRFRYCRLYCHGCARNHRGGHPVGADGPVLYGDATYPTQSCPCDAARAGFADCRSGARCAHHYHRCPTRCYG